MIDKGFWTIPSVSYRGQIQPVELMKSLLNDGGTRTQQEWAEHYQEAKPRGDFHSSDNPLFYGIVKAVMELGDESSEEIRQFLKENSRARWLMTLTRIAYQPSGLDKVIHNYETSDIYERSVQFVGPDREIGKGDTKACQALLDTRDSIEQINSVFKYLNGTDTWIFRINEKPDVLDERVAWLDAYSVWFVLNCFGDPSDRDASLGVRFASG